MRQPCLQSEEAYPSDGGTVSSDRGKVVIRSKER